MEDMLAEDREEACCFVHALKADGAGGEFDEGRCGWGVGFGGEGCGHRGAVDGGGDASCWWKRSRGLLCGSGREGVVCEVGVGGGIAVRVAVLEVDGLYEDDMTVLWLCSLVKGVRSRVVVILPPCC